MKKLVLVLALLATLHATAPRVYAAEPPTAIEFVFTEAELKQFLQKNIKEAVDKATAELVRDHEVEKILLIEQKDEQKNRADSLESRVRFEPVKIVLGVVAGLGVGYMLGKLSNVF